MRACAFVAVLLVASVVSIAVPVTQSSPFDTFFTENTMRVDFVHSGGLGQEIVALDRVVSDGPWPGSRTRLVDDLNLGKYLFEVIDRATNRTIYSRGFASVYGEWETTPEYRKIHRSFSESLRFPWPKAPVQVVLKKRDRENSFHEFWSTVVDPNSRFVNRATPLKAGTVWTLFENGPAAQKVDILLISEGYTAGDMPKFHADAKRLVDALFAVEPFLSRKSDFNVRGLDLPSPQSGVNRPHVGSFRRTPISA
ncbi:MAG: peptidase M64 N-terminal domain-containing protein, partial [Vicinamibacterales bacterium]